MAFVSIPGSQIEVGRPVKKELWLTAKNNFDDHELRISNIEVGSVRVEVAKIYLMNAASFSTATGFFYYEADRPFTITSAFIRIFEKGSLGGSVEMDIKRSTTNLSDGNFSSIFTVKPKINYSSASDYEQSTNQVFDPTKIQMLPGNFLRIDLTQLPSGGVLSRLLITIFGE